MKKIIIVHIFTFLQLLALVILGPQIAIGYEATCASGGPDNVGQTSCTFNATKNGITYHLVDNPVYYCKTHYSAATACAVAASPNDGLVPLSPTALSGSWAHACGNSWGSYSASITAVPESMKGKCGTATSTPSYSQPTTNNCGPIGGIVGGPISTMAEAADTITGTNPQWKWKCMGTLGSTSVDDAICSASMIVDGACGSANSPSYSASTNPPPSSPFGTLCSYPTSNTTPAVSITSNCAGTSCTFNWGCPGANGGVTASCSAKKISNGVCSGSPQACYIGQYVEIDGNMWRCKGVNGGDDTICSNQGAKCGTANDQYISPSSVLANGHLSNYPNFLGECNKGAPSGLGSPNAGGQYNWTCYGLGPVGTGVNDGLNGATNYCPTGYVCADGTVVTNRTSCSSGSHGGLLCNHFIDSYNPTYLNNYANDCVWTNVDTFVCAPISSSVSCSSTSSAVDGACGTAAKAYTSTATSFSGSFCSSPGAPSPSPTFPSQGYSVSWTCPGSGGGNPATCSASRTQSSGGTVQLTTLIVTPLINSGGSCTAYAGSSLSRFQVPAEGEVYPYTHCELRNQYTSNILLNFNSDSSGSTISNYIQEHVTRDTLYTFRCRDIFGDGTNPNDFGPWVTKTGICRINTGPKETP